MPRRAKGPRLYFRKAKGNRKAVYVIRDGQHEYSTGTVDREEAEAELRLYLNRKIRDRKRDDPNELTVAEALVQYGEGPAAAAEDSARIGYAIEALDKWWGDLPVSEIDAAKCRAYCKDRAKAPGTLRRELGCLRAALNYALPAGIAKNKLWMPPKPAPKDVWLTRSEAAKLIKVARSDPKTRHLARFILIALYTGSRKSVILKLKFHRHSTGGYVDTARGLLYRKAAGSRETKKRAPNIQIPSRLLAHLRRWERLSQNGWVIEYQGCGVASIKTAWRNCCRKADLRNVTPHSLRHTAITWAMQAGVDKWQAGGFFGVSQETLEKVYAHHHPDFLSDAVEAVNRGGRSSA